MYFYVRQQTLLVLQRYALFLKLPKNLGDFYYLTEIRKKGLDRKKKKEIGRN